MKKTVKDQSGAGKLKIGELLSKAGYITLAQLENAKKELQKNGGRLSSILRQLDYIDENTVFNFLSRQHNYPPVVIQNEPPSKDALKLLPYETAKIYLAFPLGWRETPCRSPWPNPPIRWPSRNCRMP